MGGPKGGAGPVSPGNFRRVGRGVVTLTRLCCRTSQVRRDRQNCLHQRRLQRNPALRLVLVKTQIAEMVVFFSLSPPLPLKPSELKLTAITAGTPPSQFYDSVQHPLSTVRVINQTGWQLSRETSMQIDPGYISPAPETLYASRFPPVFHNVFFFLSV